jgi:hypothetical protein
MSFLDRLLGRERRDAQPPEGQYRQPGYGQVAAGRSADEVAVERYRYLLRTAPPEAIEQAHAEAFGKLTPEQRRTVLNEVGSAVPPAERARTDDPRDLARMATRAEMRQPGTMERVLGRGGVGGGIGMGGLIAGSLLASVAGAFVGTAIAEQFFDGSGGDAAASEGDAGGDTGGEQASADAGGADAGGADAGGYDAGGFDGGGFDGGGFDAGGFDGGF